jgi:hypothetical protein
MDKFGHNGTKNHSALPLQVKVVGKFICRVKNI